MAEMPAFPVIVTHLEDAPGSGLAACSGRPFRTPGGFSNFARWLCTGCARYARPEPLPPEDLAAAMNAAFTYEDRDNSQPTLPFIDDIENFWEPFAAKVAGVMRADE